MYIFKNNDKIEQTFANIYSKKGQRMKELLMQIKETLLLVLDNNITFFVVVPILILISPWIKNAYDTSLKNKELGRWIKTYTKKENFIDISLKAYKRLGIIFLIALMLQLFIEFYVNTISAYVVSGMVYIVALFLWTLILRKNELLRVELLANRSYKIRALIFLNIIFIITYFLATRDETYYFSQILFCVLLIAWAIYLLKEYEIVYRLDNKYVDIFVQGNSCLKGIETSSIKKQGVWIYATRYRDGKKENICIKEDEITGANYYGEPSYIIRKVRLFGKTVDIT